MTRLSSALGVSDATLFTRECVEEEFSEVRGRRSSSRSPLGGSGWGYVASPDGRSRPSSMNSPPRKYPRSTTYSSPRSRSRRAEYGVCIPVLGEMLTTRTLRPSKSTFRPRLAASIASSYFIAVGLRSSVIRGSLPSGPWPYRDCQHVMPFSCRRELRLDGVLRSSHSPGPTRERFWSYRTGDVHLSH